MATKRSPPPAKKAQRPGSKAAPRSVPKSNGLVATEHAGVYRNSAGILCDKSGVMLTLIRAKAVDAEELSAVVDGEPVDTPAKFLKAVALNPLLPLETRVDAAKAAAPYTDRKQPQGVDGGVDPKTGAPKAIAMELSMDEETIKRLPVVQQEALRAALLVLRDGVAGTPGPSAT